MADPVVGRYRIRAVGMLDDGPDLVEHGLLLEADHAEVCKMLGHFTAQRRVAVLGADDFARIENAVADVTTLRAAVIDVLGSYGLPRAMCDRLRAALQETQR